MPLDAVEAVVTVLNPIVPSRGAKMAYLYLINMPKWHIVLIMDAMTIKEARIKAKLTQIQAAQYVGIPLRTYLRYEQGLCASEIKRDFIMNKLSGLSEITEEKGLLDMESIRQTVSEICSKHGIPLCYLFGSYAKGFATESSDVDLLIDTTITGLSFFGLVEEFREALHKKVDLLRLDDVKENKALLFEIMKDGVKIYG